LAAADFEISTCIGAAFGPDAVIHSPKPTDCSDQLVLLRQALAVADPGWGQVYEPNMISEIAVIGRETFYLRSICDGRA
jgi:hypothetical protein